MTPQEVPALLPEALTTVEDRKFYTHHGVDPTGIARALWQNVRAGQIEQGGSTLTQQLVKSYFLDPRRTLSRKVRRSHHGGLARYALQQGGSHERVHQ